MTDIQFCFGCGDDKFIQRREGKARQMPSKIRLKYVRNSEAF